MIDSKWVSKEPMLSSRLEDDDDDDDVDDDDNN